MKILHTADLHLDSPLVSLALRDPDLGAVIQTATRAALERIVETALEERCAAVLISGDLFDGRSRSARTAAHLMAQLDRLGAAGIRVFLIKGNHDAETPLTGAMSLPSNTHLFDARGGKEMLADGVWIHGVSFGRPQAPDSLLDRFPAPVPDAVNIAMLHTSLAGAAGHDPYAPCTVAELSRMGFDYWALGHVHKRAVHSTDPWVVMPGMPQGRDIGEAGPKSATLIEIEGRSLTCREIPTSAVEFAAHRIDITGAEEAEEVRALIRAELSGLAGRLDSDAGVLRLTLAGGGPLAWEVTRDRAAWAEIAAGIARDTGRLWLEALGLDFASEPAAATVDAGALGELYRLMEEAGAEPAVAEAIRRDLEATLGELPPARRAALMPDAEATEALAADLTARAARRMRALMTKAGG